MGVPVHVWRFQMECCQRCQSRWGSAQGGGGHAVAQSPPLRPQNQSLCPGIKVKSRLLQILQRPLHELKGMAVNAWTTFGWDHGPRLLIRLSGTDTYELDRQQNHRYLHVCSAGSHGDGPVSLLLSSISRGCVLHKISVKMPTE